MSTTPRGWTMVGLPITFFAMPVLLGFFQGLGISLTTQNVTAREIALLACAAALLFIIRRKERLGWDSVGLQRPRFGNTALWVLITFLGVALATAPALGVIKLLQLPVGSEDSAAYAALPTWVLLLIIVRAAFVEELFYRGYTIERLQTLTGNRTLSVALPLLAFAVFHYRQGWAGIIIALFLGAVLTGVYVYKRNLWITITTHFVGDLIPNILVPLFAPEGTKP